jgi:hypothetical protein
LPWGNCIAICLQISIICSKANNCYLHGLWSLSTFKYRILKNTNYLICSKKQSDNNRRVLKEPFPFLPAHSCCKSACIHAHPWLWEGP